MATARKTLDGRRILIVEDDWFVVTELVRTLEAQGAAVVGPVPTVQQALALLETGDPLDGAVLDVNLRGEMAFPVADALIARGVPFLFTTGYDPTVIPGRFAAVKRCDKPASPAVIAAALAG